MSAQLTRASHSARSPDWIALDGAVNARAVVSGVLLRADNLQDLTARDIRLLVEEHGLEVVLDLRSEFEVRAEGPGPLTDEPAVTIEHYSLYPESGVNTDLEADTVKPWATEHDDSLAGELPVVGSYMSYLSRRPDSIVASVRTIAQTRGSVLVHCAAGKDRTGVVVALALDAAGIERPTIIADYLATADRIDAILGRLSTSPTYRDEIKGDDPRTHAPAIGTMERVLALVDELHGGAAAWLTAHGLSEADLLRLRERVGLAAPHGGP